MAGDSCSSDETCSPRLRTLRQCVAGNGSMKLGPGARSQCANAVSALLTSPLHGCQCKRGMKKEKNCLSIYWSLHQSVIHGLCSYAKNSLIFVYNTWIKNTKVIKQTNKCIISWQVTTCIHLPFLSFIKFRGAVMV